MGKTKNVILIDFPKIDDWEFKKSLQEETNMEWEECGVVSNHKRQKPFSDSIRILKYFLFPLTIFFKRKQYKNIIAWQQFYGLLYAFYCRLFHTKKYNRLIVMTFIYKEKKGILR